MSGILTSFGRDSPSTSTKAFSPPDCISILLTVPFSISANNSEYANLLLELSIIDEINTINIIKNINHTANDLIPFFNLIPPITFYEFSLLL